jgi:geranylgeranyl transferase type-1 subunit beta
MSRQPTRYLLLDTSFRNLVLTWPIDIYHSYLGLAALAIMKDPCLKSFDSALCVSMQQRERIGRLRKDAFIPMEKYWRHGV